MINEKDVFDALKKVIEPDLGKNIVELGLVTLVSSSDKSLLLRVETKNAAMHDRKRMKEACEFAIERSFGNQINAEVEVVAMKKAEASQTEATSVQDKLDKLYNAIVPLLNNLKKNPEKEYIFWPDRLTKDEAFEDHLQKIYKG